LASAWKIPSSWSGSISPDVRSDHLALRIDEHEVRVARQPNACAPFVFAVSSATGKRPVLAREPRARRVVGGLVGGAGGDPDHVDARDLVALGESTRRGTSAWQCGQPVREEDQRVRRAGGAAGLDRRRR
jgi:hypothetical protein